MVNDQRTIARMLVIKYFQAVTTIHTGSMMAARSVDRITSRPVSSAFN
jgi:hypothetical protein